jgi:hypothetical protein
MRLSEYLVSSAKNGTKKMCKCGSKSKKGSKNILVVLHTKNIFWVIEHKPGYLEHTNSYFESKNCVTKLRLRDTNELIIFQNFHLLISICFLLSQGWEI